MTTGDITNRLADIYGSALRGWRWLADEPEIIDPQRRPAHESGTSSHRA
jgi:hypothetical protein